MIAEKLILFGFMFICLMIILATLIIWYKTNNKPLPPTGLPKVPAPPPQHISIDIDEWFPYLEKEIEDYATKCGIDISRSELTADDLEFIDAKMGFPFRKATIGYIPRTDVSSKDLAMSNLSVEFCPPVTRVIYTIGSIIYCSSAKCAEGETFDLEKGVAVCLAKIIVKNGQLRRLVKTAKWIEPEAQK